MKLPIPLLLLVVVGTIASRVTSESSPATGQTTKRELPEGNFGQKIVPLDKKESPKSTPGIQYAEDQKRNPPEQSVAAQFFGGRILPITKISDLLTGQGLPFDIALTNQLYAPVSVYNTRPTLDELPKTETTNNIVPNYKINAEDVEDRQKKTLSRTPGFHIPGLLGPEFYSQENRYLPKLTKYVPPTPNPRHFLYQELSQIDPYIPIQYYEHQRLAQRTPATTGIEGVNQDSSQVDDKSSLRKTELPSKIDQHSGSPVGRKTYHAHPHGAVSYSNFLHNQPPIEAQPSSLNIYKQPIKSQQEINEAEFSRYEDLHVPHPPLSKPQSQEGKSAPTQIVQQFRPISQQLFSPEQHRPEIFSQGRPLFLPSGFEFNSGQQPNYQEFYRRPFTNLHQTNQKYLKNQHPAFQRFPNIGFTFEPSLQITNLSKPNVQSVSPLQSLHESKSGELLVQQNTEGILVGQQQQNLIHGTVSHQQSVIPLNKSLATTAPQVTITPKSQLSKDKHFQSTTIQPDIISDTSKVVTAKYVSKESNQQQVTQPTLKSLLVSPVTLQSLSTLPPSEYYLFSTPQPQLLIPQEQQTTPYHQVQIQQQKFHEIHSELLPSSQAETQYPSRKITKEEPQSLDLKPNQYQSTTPQSAEASSPDYEIEIASNVDHSKVPKDLRPLPGTRENNDLVESQQTDEQKTSLHILQNQTNVEQVHPHIAAIQAFGEPPSYQNINYHDPNSFYLDSAVSLGQPILEPQFFSQHPPFAIRPHVQYPHAAFPPVQYFGKYAESIFGGF